MVDVVIIGGSYAGLAAAMSMGRALRNILNGYLSKWGDGCGICDPDW
jgi:thioredoxin reductase